ncbi:Pr6Pr family membrane protein [Brachybacterium sp. DNPG3]
MPERPTARPTSAPATPTESATPTGLRERCWPWARLAAAVLCAGAVLIQLGMLIASIPVEYPGQGPTAVANFFSYFTNLSNLSAAAVLAIAGIRALRGRHRAAPASASDASDTSDASDEPAWLTTALICVSTYMIVTGVVYNLLLRDASMTGFWWLATNEAVHTVGPLFLLADVLLAPRRRRPRWAALGAAAAFPIVWAVYTMARAPFVTSPTTGEAWWYPYPFLDPHLVPGGFVGVAGYIVGIAAIVVGLAAGIIAIGRRRTRSIAPVPDPAPR